MDKILTKQEAVELYGTDVQKEHFQNYGKFKSQSIENSLIKTIEQYYEKVEKIKVGRSIAYGVTGKKENITDRVDYRRENFGKMTRFTNSLDILIASTLETEKIKGIEIEASQTLNLWALEFGIITPEMFSLLQSRYNDELRNSHVVNLKDKNIIKSGEQRILDDFCWIVGSITTSLKSTFERMKKSGIIHYYEVYKGHTHEGDVELHSETHKRIESMRSELLAKYDITEFEVSSYKNKPRVIQFNEEYRSKLKKIKDEKGETLNLDYIYKTYAVFLKGRTKNKVVKYLNKRKDTREMIKEYNSNPDNFICNNKCVFEEEKEKRIINASNRNEKKFLEPRCNRFEKELYIECGMGEEEATIVATELPSMEKYLNNNDSEYYELYFSRLYAKKIKELQDYYNTKIV